MKTLLERIRVGEAIIADGAMGSLLMAIVNESIEKGCVERLNLTRPDILEKVTQLYLDAGAEILQTNTFGASPLKLERCSLSEQTEEINRRAVQAVMRAAQGKAYISASCGPSGRILKPYGDVDESEVFDSFHRQIRSLVDAGTDILCIETMTDLREAVLAVKAGRSISGTIPVMATMSFTATPRGFFTVMGNSIAQTVAELSAAGADIIGSNCGNGIENMVAIAAEFKKLTSLPLIIQANAGMPVLAGEKTLYPDTPEFMAEQCPRLIAAGVSIIGGCCGTTPEHIRAMARAVKSSTRR